MISHALRAFAFLICWANLALAQGGWLGVNLSGVSDSSSQLVFKDLFKQSRPWLTRLAEPGGPWDIMAPVPSGPDGWPSAVPFPGPSGLPTLPHTLMARDINGHYPGGEYEVCIEGDTGISLSFDAGNAALSGPGCSRVTVRPTAAGIGLTVRRNGASSPLKSLTLVPQSLAGSESGPFHPVFLQRLSPFKVLRFMDMQGTNASPLTAWEDRPRPGWATQAGPKGTALEYIMDICVRTGATPWLCLPHMADEGFARGMARLVRDSLPAGSSVYLEYSNETWNAIFPQAEYVKKMGQLQHLSRDPFLAGIRFTVKRSLELFASFEGELGGRIRVYKVLAGQTANPWVAGQMLQSLRDPAVNPGGMRVDTLAIAPYLGHDIVDEIARAGRTAHIWPEEVVGMLSGQLPALEKQVAAHAGLARQVGVTLSAYEGGQHLVGGTAKLRDDPMLTDLIARANAHPSMRRLYLDLLRMWRANGGGVFNLFAYVGMPSKYGCWGLLEWLEQPLESAPKYLAAMEASAWTTETGTGIKP
jgi:hypothetical protein